MTTATEARVRLPAPPRPAQVLHLQSLSAYPSVSLLLSTTPAAQMRPDDHGRLLALLAEARDRLAAEGMLGSGDRGLLGRLQELVDRAAADATGRAVAIYANEYISTVLTLPVPVEDRVVIDPTFATRDLVRAMHRTPRHVVLVLSSREAKLYDGVAGQLHAVVGNGFPLLVERADRGQDPARPGLKDSELASFLRSVDRALGVHLRLHPAPLVLVGPDRVVSAFKERSRNVGRLAGVVTSNLSHSSLAVLADRIRPELDMYLRGREQEAMVLLDRRVGEDRAVSGIAAAWLAARRERPEMLAVEEGLFVPARISDDGDSLMPADDVEHPEVIDDAVDELIELVLDRGGWVALVGDGALAAHEGVALAISGRY